MITCGYFVQDTGTEMVKRIYWKINVKWTVPINVFEIADAVDANGMNANPMSDGTKCNKNNKDLSVVTIEKGTNNLIAIDTKAYGVSSMYAKQTFYFFDKIKLNNKNELLKPCGIALVFYEIPNFVVGGNRDRIKSTRNQDIFLVPSLSSGKRKYNIKLLEMENLDAPEFYADEEISSQRMIYRDRKLKPIGDKEVIKKGELNVEDYEIIQFSYSALSKGKKYKEVAETFFFGPGKHYVNPKPITVNFTKNDSDIEANCPINLW
uniref:Lipoprotein n=1 Tax=Parastrongyloides trichosuri TaxID=131310 RepID=A0A0N4Z859_PARTI